MRRIATFHGVLLLAMFVAVSDAGAQPSEPLEWYRDYDQAAKVARARVLPLILVFTRHEYVCHECPRLEATLRAPEMAGYRQRAVFVWIDTTGRDDHSVNAQLALRHKIVAYPAVVLVHPFIEGAIPQTRGQISGYPGSTAAFLRRFDELLAVHPVFVVKSFDDLPEEARNKNKELDDLWKSYESQKVVDRFDAEGRLSADNIERVLRELGYTPEKRSTSAGTEYRLLVKSGPWQHDLRLSLSAAGDGVWLRSPLVSIDPGTAPAGTLITILGQSSTREPVYFSYDRAQRKLWLNRFLVNVKLTQSVLRQELERLMQAVKVTQPYWDPSRWGK